MSLVNTIHHTNTPINGVSAYSTKMGNLNVVFEITGNNNEMLDLKSIRILSLLFILN